VIGLRLSRNFGHQNAVMAGLLSASGDALISIDADLQDDIDVIPEMLEQFQAGNEIVYGVRRERQSDTALKRGSALLYYRLLKLLGVDVIHNHADFRLMSRKAVDCLKQFSEVNLFLRGIVPLLGFQTGTVEYDRQERAAGQTKYNLRRMIALAINGITSFSPAPLRMVAALGLIVFLLTVAMTFWVLWIRFFTDQAIPGWASSVIPIYFLGGIQLLSIGVLGEYVSKLYLESKQRPRYFIAETTGD
jgi:glycosyltransferase involved in cell wall biosynthesis